MLTSLLTILCQANCQCWSSHVDMRRHDKTKYTDRRSLEQGVLQYASSEWGRFYFAPVVENGNAVTIAQELLCKV